jgi:hypothetical protein
MDKFLLPIFKALFNRQLVEDIYKESSFSQFFWILIVVTLLGCLFFYRNPFAFRTRFYKFNHWFTTGIITGFICFAWSILICLLEAQERLPREVNDPTLGEYFDSGFSVFLPFGLTLWVISFVLYFLLSIGFRYLSLNASKTPF